MAAHTEEIDRLRRIETKLTKLLNAQGLNAYADEPTYSNKVLHVPTSNISLKDCLAAIPDGPRDFAVPVHVHGEVLCYLGVPQA